MIRFVPTVTGNVDKFDYAGVDEVLFSPHEGDTLPPVKNIIIDNHGFYINNPLFVRSKERIFEIFNLHIEQCKRLKDPRTIFILPDIKLLPEFCHDAINIFLDTVQPTRFVLVDGYGFFEHFPNLVENSEFYGLPAGNKPTLETYENYHLFAPKDIVEEARSWDTSQFTAYKELSRGIKEMQQSIC